MTSSASFSGMIGREMAVDLGTANTLVYVRGYGIVLNEPSVVAVNVRDGRPLAVGLEAKRMIGRTPAHIQAIRPLKDGVIADFEICEKMLGISSTRCITVVGKREVICCLGHHGRRTARRQEAPSMPAPASRLYHRGAHGRGHRRGLPCKSRPEHDRRHGGGTTKCGDLARRHRVESVGALGGDDLDEAIIAFVKKEYSLALGEATAEEIKMRWVRRGHSKRNQRGDPRTRSRHRSTQDDSCEHEKYVKR